MDQLLPIFILSVVSSMDGFLLGWCYGIQHSRIRPVVWATVGLCSGMTFSLFMQMVTLAPHPTASDSYHMHRIAGILMIASGIWSLFRTLKKEAGPDSAGECLSGTGRSCPDQPERFPFWDAVKLGLFLSADAAAAGTAAALLHLPVLLSSVIITLISVLMLMGGYKTGLMGRRKLHGRSVERIAGLMLIGYGCNIWWTG